MMRVIVKSVFDAFEYVMQHYYPVGLNEMVEKRDTYAVISIQDTHTGGFGFNFCENQYCKGVLTLYVDDIVSEVDNAILFSDDMAIETIHFILTHRNVDTLLVHCYAGQSRSRAVGAFVVKMFGGDNKAFFDKYDPNIHIYNTLINNWTRIRMENKTTLPKQIDDSNIDIHDELNMAKKYIDKFCHLVPQDCMEYLDDSCDLSDIYYDMLALSKNQKNNRKQEIKNLLNDMKDIVMKYE